MRQLTLVACLLSVGACLISAAPLLISNEPRCPYQCHRRGACVRGVCRYHHRGCTREP